MGDLSDEELRARLQYAMGELHGAPFIQPLRELQNHRARRTADAERVREVVRAAIDHSRHLPHGQAERVIANRVAEQLGSPVPLSTADLAILKRLRDNEARVCEGIGHLDDGIRRATDAAIELLDRLLGATS